MYIYTVTIKPSQGQITIHWENTTNRLKMKENAFKWEKHIIFVNFGCDCVFTKSACKKIDSLPNFPPSITWCITLWLNQILALVLNIKKGHILTSHDKLITFVISIRLFKFIKRVKQSKNSCIILYLSECRWSMVLILWL